MSWPGTSPDDGGLLPCPFLSQFPKMTVGAVLGPILIRWTESITSSSEVHAKAGRTAKSQFSPRPPWFRYIHHWCWTNAKTRGKQANTRPAIRSICEREKNKYMNNLFSTF